MRGYAPQAGRGRATAHAPYRPQFAISNPLRLSRMALRLAPADLLTGLFIRASHRMARMKSPARLGALPPVPRPNFYFCHSAPIPRPPWRGIGAPTRSCRRNAFWLIMTACGRNVRSVQMHISRLESSIGLNCYCNCNRSAVRLVTSDDWTEHSLAIHPQVL